jgi:hypothetical protein
MALRTSEQAQPIEEQATIKKAQLKIYMLIPVGRRPLVGHSRLRFL